VALDVAAEAQTLTAALRALAPNPTVVPIIVAALADRLWHTGIREEQLVACFLLAGDRAALAATDPARVRAWTALLDNWETTDQLGMNVLGPLVALDPDRRFPLLEALAHDPDPWARRLALVACTRLARAEGAAGRWPRVARLLLEVAGDREAALPKAASWVLRSWLAACPDQVAAFVDRQASRLPAVAVRETRAKLATGTKRPPRPRAGTARAVPAGGRR
jgi:3-methyladenine DNA glycosylase AlkD